MRYVMTSMLALALAAAPAAAQSSQELERKVAELTRRVEALEARLGPKAPAPPSQAAQRPAAAAAPAAASAGREEALALYERVDNLVARGSLDAAQAEVAAWDRQYAGTPGAGWTSSLKRELTVVGKSAPADWAIEHWYQGESDVKLDGQRPTLLVFWEAWCPHCRDEVPKMEQLWKQYGDKGLQVVGVTRITRTATEESVREFLAQSGVAYPMAKENGSLADYFEVKGIPAAAVVKDGKIVWRGHPLRLTDELLTAWF